MIDTFNALRGIMLSETAFQILPATVTHIPKYSCTWYIIRFFSAWSDILRQLHHCSQLYFRTVDRPVRPDLRAGLQAPLPSILMTDKSGHVGFI